MLSKKIENEEITCFLTSLNFYTLNLKVLSE